MPFASYQDIWLETGDPAGVARFWATALGLDVEPFGAGGRRLTGSRPEQTMFVVPSTPGTLDGFRIHADVTEAGLADLQRLSDPDGGDDEPWLELHGPEASEVRCFLTPDPLEGRRYELVLAARQPARAARWWARVFGAVHESAAGGDYGWVSEIPGAPFESLVFTRELPTPPRRRARMRLTTTDLQGLFRHGAAMVTGERAPTVVDTGRRFPAHVMRCAEGIDFVVLDISGAPELARTPQPVKPMIGPR